MVPVLRISDVVIKILARHFVLLAKRELGASLRRLARRRAEPIHGVDYLVAVAVAVAHLETEPFDNIGLTVSTRR